MSIKKLTIAISEYDTDIRDIVAPALNGGLDVTFKKYSKLPDLGEYEGGSKYPLTLVGHANGKNMKVGIQSYASGKDICEALLGKNLDPSTFPFCLIAGCNAGEGGEDGLYAVIAEKLNIPVVASTTAIRMGRSGGNVELTPQSGGRWRVCMPSVGGMTFYTLHSAAACQFINDILDTQEFKCKAGVA